MLGDDGGPLAGRAAAGGNAVPRLGAVEQHRGPAGRAQRQARSRRRLNDEALAEMEKLPGVAAAYPDAHVKEHPHPLRQQGDDRHRAGHAAARPRCWASRQEILVAGRLFEEGDRPEAIVGTQVVSAWDCNRRRRPSARRSRSRRPGWPPKAASKFTFSREAHGRDDRGRLPCAGDHGPPRPSSGIFLPVELDEANPRHVHRIGLEHRRSRAAT